MAIGHSRWLCLHLPNGNTYILAANYLYTTSLSTWFKFNQSGQHNYMHTCKLNCARSDTCLGFRYGSVVWSAYACLQRSIFFQWSLVTSSDGNMFVVPFFIIKTSDMRSHLNFSPGQSHELEWSKGN